MLFANQAVVVTTFGELNLPCCSRLIRVCRIRRQAEELACTKTRYANGARSGAPARSGLLTFPDVAASRVFPPSVVTEVKAAACDNAGARAKGLSYFSIRDLAKLVMQKLSLPTLAPSTVWDILDQDAIKPWQYRSWIFPRDPEFAKYADVVLDLYQGYYMGERLDERDFVFSGDEKPGLLLRTRCRPTVLPAPGKAGLIEFEYRRHGTATLLALMEISSGLVFHQTVHKSGILPFKNLIDKLLGQEPYRNARRLSFVVDNGSSHGRKRFQERLSEWFPQPDYPEMIAVHTPKHASWLNQVELFFSIVGRKALKHVQCRTREAMIDHIARFIERYNKNATPFNWRFTKDDLAEKMKKWQDPILN